MPLAAHVTLAGAGRHTCIAAAAPCTKAFQALDPFFRVVLEGLRGLVDGQHYFDAFAMAA
jgi:hypothetical protein